MTVQRQSPIEGLCCARFRAKDAINSQLILFYGFKTACSEGFVLRATRHGKSRGLYPQVNSCCGPARS